MRTAELFLAVMTVAALAEGPAQAASVAHLNVPAGRLGDAVIAVAQQANVSIGIGDPAIAGLPTRALRGRMRVDDALRKLLRGLPARAEHVDATSWRVVGAAAAPVEPRAEAIAPPPIVHEADIVVTAAKTGTSLSRYAGAVSIVTATDLSFADKGRGSEALVDRLPALSSTHLGTGRNKLFIRGVADSSFNGPSQALVGQYLGDVRLNYNAPDPDISLYDIQSVEVIEGPQGTLYGAGSLGGVVRIVPQPVVMSNWEGGLTLGRSYTRHGAPGYDVTGLLNVPLGDQVGARFVAFHQVDGGYIDDVGRGKDNVNRTSKSGGRAAIRFNLGDWRVDLGGLVQDINARDGQYATDDEPALTRVSRVAQPFDNDYMLGSVGVSRDWGQTSFLTTSAIVHHTVDARYDFTQSGAAQPRVFDQENKIRLFSNETRLSRRKADGRGWVVGASFVYDDERLTRALGELPTPPRILGLDNSVTEGALFGEAGMELLPRLIATAGLRFEYTHLVGNALDRDAAIGEPRRDEKTILPSVSLSWRADPHWLVYARYQEGFRPGGLSITPGTPAPTIERFHGDSLASLEGGVKWTPGKRLDASLVLSHAHWEDIQADLVDMIGLPITANVGSGRVLGAEASVGWRPIDGLHLSAGGFANDSRLTKPAAGFTGEDYELPNIAHFGAVAHAAYSYPLANGWSVDADANMRYVGHSRLGVGPQLDIRQGNYGLLGASLRIGTPRWGLTVDGQNLLDNRGNMFALGNPFDVRLGDQRVPPRPRTVRVGLDASF